MGTVYRATHILMEKTVAIKVLHPSLAADEKIVARFSREAKAASRISHPHAISVTDFGESENGVVFLVMEYLRGQTLKEIIRAEGPLPLPRVVEIIRQVSGALETAHAEGVVHRDLKSDNITRRRRECAGLGEVLDFASPRSRRPLAARDPALTAPHLIIGTAAVHVAAAVLTGIRDRRALGYLFARRHPLRDACGSCAVYGRVADGDYDEAFAGTRPFSDRGAKGSARECQSRCYSRPLQAPRRSLSERERTVRGFISGDDKRRATAAVVRPRRRASSPIDHRNMRPIASSCRRPPTSRRRLLLRARSKMKEPSFVRVGRRAGLKNRASPLHRRGLASAHGAS